MKVNHWQWKKGLHERDWGEEKAMKLFLLPSESYGLYYYMVYGLNGSRGVSYEGYRILGLMGGDGYQ